MTLTDTGFCLGVRERWNCVEQARGVSLLRPSENGLPSVGENGGYNEEAKTPLTWPAVAFVASGGPFLSTNLVAGVSLKSCNAREGPQLRRIAEIPQIFFLSAHALAGHPELA